jgi:hypothetical protein
LVFGKIKLTKKFKKGGIFMSGAPTGKDSQRDLFLEHIDLKKNHEDLQQNYDKLLKQNQDAVQFIKEAIISVNLAVPAFEGLWHRVPGNQLSDQQKLAIAAAESLKALIKSDLRSIDSQP